MNKPIAKLNDIPVRRGGDVLLEVLESEGVEYVFGNPGTTELPFMDALLRNPNINYVLALQEASAVAMADGYAQAAGKPGFLNLHTAGGLGHGMGNLHNAVCSQTPLVVTAGQQDLRHSITDPLLLGDLVSMGKIFSKWSKEVTSVDQLPILVRRAFHDADAAPKGPVFLSLPMDVMEAMSSVDIGAPSNVDRKAVAGSLPLLAKKLAAFTPGKVAIIAGDEIHQSGAAAEVVALAELLAADVYGSTWPNRIPYPTAHPLWRGNLSTQAIDIAKALDQYDAIFALGGKSLITILYTEGRAVPEHCKVFQLSADAGDLGRTYRSELSTLGDIKLSLAVLLPELKEATAHNRPDYQRRFAAAAAQFEQTKENLFQSVQEQQSATKITPLIAAFEAARAIGPDITIVDEAIATSQSLRRSLSSNRADQYAFMRGGGLGWGMPAAVGYSLGLGKAPVVCFVGDGAAMYSPQSLWTAAHEQLPVTFIVMNNTEYNVLKNFMRSKDDYTSAQTNRFIAMDLVDPVIDYQALGTALGLKTRKIEVASQIAAAVEEAIASGKPSLIEIVIAKN
ncbi:thiamine pyrophosphate-binding protein [Pantoea dispersa]|uniref:thiamine pyrophosphate-binding protein n=1 Tax=Pantoea dispersa TaxID=59814 RepID=UPI001CA63255|nr:thiamine pyrophosphate-binding protein [Pantoea dispersa]QZY97460.1 thiamine pyrophosphate-binding protein [Pantoea dispersa]